MSALLHPGRLDGRRQLTVLSQGLAGFAGHGLGFRFPFTPLGLKCVASTDAEIHRFVDVRIAVAGNAPSLLAEFVPFLLIACRLELLLFEKEQRGFERKCAPLRLRMPQCEVCSQAGKPVPKSADAEKLPYVICRGSPFSECNYRDRDAAR